MKILLNIILLIVIISATSCVQYSAQPPGTSQPYTPYTPKPTRTPPVDVSFPPPTPYKNILTSTFESPNYITITSTQTRRPDSNNNEQGSNPNFDPIFMYESRIILNELVDELRFQMNNRQYQEFLDFQNDWEFLALRQCRWQAEIFFANSSPLEQEDECLYKQYLQRIDVLLVLLCRKYGTTGECQDSRKYREMVQNIGN